MHNLLEFFKKYNYWFLFVVLELLSIVLLFRFNSYQGSVWFCSANSVAGTVLSVESEVHSYLNLGMVNKDLVAKNIVLEQRVEKLQAALLHATHDSTYTEVRQAEILSGDSLIAARVVNNSVRKRNNFITIDRGTLDGVKPEMGVVCGTGVVGIVYLAAPHYSVVMPILNSKSKISCRLRKKDYFGSLEWDGENPLYGDLRDIPLHAKLKTGDVVETSGYSAVFPPGIFVGRVADIHNSDDGLSYELKVNLGTDFARLRNVCVVATPHRVELNELQQRLDSTKLQK